MLYNLLMNASNSIAINPIGDPRFYYADPTQDPYWDNVVFLMRFNNNFLDDKGHIVNLIGNPTIVDDPTSPFAGKVGLLDREGKFLSVTTNFQDMAFGTNDFDIDYIFKTSIPENGVLLEFRPPMTSGVYPNLSIIQGKVGYYSDTYAIEDTIATSDNNYHHYRIKRTNNILSLIIDERLVGSVVDNKNYLIGQLLVNSGAYRGSAGSSAQDVMGSIAYIRITNGIARD